MTPWFAPLQVITSLGITVPFFVYYAWRFYNHVLEHRQALATLGEAGWVDRLLVPGWNRDEVSAQLALSSVGMTFDRRIGAVRRSLRADVYVIILIGFIGTLIGMIGSFTTLLMSVGNAGLDPAVAITTLIRGGLSTALVSSLIAAVLASVVMGYLSATEKALVRIKQAVNGHCLARYQEPEPIPQEVVHAVV